MLVKEATFCGSHMNSWCFIHTHRYRSRDAHEKSEEMHILLFISYLYLLKGTRSNYIFVTKEMADSRAGAEVEDEPGISL